MSQHIFVIGADEFNCQQLSQIPHHEDYEFHNLLTFDEVKGGGKYPPFDQLLEQAERILQDSRNGVDAIVGYWDFPVNSMVPILAARHHLPSPSIESEVKCDHKYWSRLEQQRVIPEFTPQFRAFDPHASNPGKIIDLDYPFWIKPIKGTDSLLAFLVENDQQFDNAINKIRNNIDKIAKPFNQLLGHVTLPSDVADIDGHCCIAEEKITGHQCTVEGYVYHGNVFIHGLIDSINYPGTSSFFRYQYPSGLSDDLAERMFDASCRIMGHIGFDNGAFNIEYFHNPDTDDIKLLEINPRISQSHSELFQRVDGASNHEIMVELALGQKPQFPRRQGKAACAAKFHLRRFQDARVERVPGKEDIDKIRRDIPDLGVDVIVKQGMQLSELIEQDSYSYDMAHLYLGAESQAQLLDKYHQAVERLPFEFSDGDNRLLIPDE